MRTRSMMTLLVLVVTNLVLLVASGAAAADTAVQATAAMPADLTGIWNLDATASDDLAGQLDALRAQMIGPQDGGRSSDGFGGEEAGVGVPGRRGAMGSMGGQSDRDARGAPAGTSGAPGAPDPRGPRELAQAMEQLLITVDGANIEIMDGSDWTRVWTPGGKPVLRDGPGGEVVEQAWWDKNVLVLSTNGDPLIITRRLALGDDGKTLVADVTVKVSGTSQRVDARLVYNGY